MWDVAEATWIIMTDDERVAWMQNVRENAEDQTEWRNFFQSMINTY
jgi:predicted Fe-S protein YdhL (DUF1289 family)